MAILSLRITNSKTIRLINTRLIVNTVVEAAIVDIANNFRAIEAIAVTVALSNVIWLYMCCTLYTSPD